MTPANSVRPFGYVASAVVGFAVASLLWTFGGADAHTPVTAPAPEPWERVVQGLERVAARLGQRVAEPATVSPAAILEPTTEEPGRTEAELARSPVTDPALDRDALRGILQELRGIRAALERGAASERGQIEGLADGLPPGMNVNAVRAVLEALRRNPEEVLGEYVLMPAREVLRRFGRPTWVMAGDDSPDEFKYELGDDDGVTFGIVDRSVVYLVER